MPREQRFKREQRRNQKKLQKQPFMSSLADTTREFTEDVASLSRVRTRFSKSTDHQLRTIVPALIPKLFKRLEHYRAVIMNEKDNESVPQHSNLDSTVLSRMEEAKKKIFDIIAMAISWLRRSEEIPVETLVRAMLPFLNSKNPVVGTYALALLQATLEKISKLESSLSVYIIPHLIESLNALHHELLQSQQATRTIDATTIQAQWIGVSWLLLDIIVLNSGKRPLQDWDMEWDTNSSTIAPSSERSGSTGVNDTKNQNRNGSSSLSFRESMEGSRKSSTKETQGVFSLILDLLLYSPLSANDATWLSALSMRRIEHRIKKIDTDNADTDDEAIQRGTRTRRRENWSNSNLAYFHHMQLAFLEFALSFPSDNEHAMVLSILFASHESMHGRIALSHLKKLRAKNSLISLPVVACLLSLIVGETQAELLLRTFEIQYETNFREQLLGSKNSNRHVNWIVGARAANFLIENPLNWKCSTKTKNIELYSNYDDVSDDAYATLFIELSLKLSDGNDDDHQFMAMRLVRNFFRHIQRPQAALVSKIFDLMMKVFTALVTSGTSEDLKIAPRGDDHNAPGLVPAPFGRRNDLNRLLQNHRQSLKRKSMDRGNAIQAREDAYTMIIQLSAHMFEQPEASKFRLPILLLQCAIFESSCLEKHLTRALDSTLAEYRIKFDNDESMETEDFDHSGTSPQQQATFILPTLLEAVCSGEEYVRMSAIQWIQKLLVHMDVEAARYLAGHLVCDKIHAISRIAKSILETTKADAPPVMGKNAITVSFISLEERNGSIEVQTDLRNREKELAERLQISQCEVSMPLLLQFKFSVDRAESEFRKNPQTCRELCGLPFGENTGMKEHTVDCLECGICYDEMEAENSYSLGCGHAFCKSCWVSYVTDASTQTPSMTFLDLRCPHHGCSARIMPHDLQQLKPSLVPTWNDALLTTFVEEDTSYRYCPGPDCRCIAMKSNQLTDMDHYSLQVTCSACTTSFCFQCGEDAHAPALCQDVAQFHLLNKSSRLWVKHHTKP